MPHDAGVTRNSKNAVLACLLEATAKKPGNVHPEVSFADLTYQDFVRSAHLIAPSFTHGAEWGVGRIIFDAVERTQLGVVRNTNLGILLLLAPLALVPAGVPLRDGIGDVLAGLTHDDAALVYAAIRLANPGGLGRVEREDVASAPSVTLLEAMRLAADRDRIATQYTSGFSTVLAGAERLAASRLFPDRWEESVIGLHLWLMAEFPDTLIGCNAARHWPASHRSEPVACLKPDGLREKVPPRNWRSSTVGCEPTGTVATRARRPTLSPVPFSRLCVKA